MGDILRILGRLTTPQQVINGHNTTGPETIDDRIEIALVVLFVCVDIREIVWPWEPLQDIQGLATMSLPRNPAARARSSNSALMATHVSKPSGGSAPAIHDAK